MGVTLTKGRSFQKLVRDSQESGGVQLAGIK